MLIGLTYDLRKDYLEIGFSEEEAAEFDSEETIHALASTIADLGHRVVRIGNIHELIKKLMRGERWNLVFNIAEGLYGRNRESQIQSILEAYNIPYTFSDPLTLSLCLDKAMAKKIVRDAEIRTPTFRVVNSNDDIDDLRDICLDYPLIVKPVAEGTGKGITRNSVVHDYENHLLPTMERLSEKYAILFLTLTHIEDWFELFAALKGRYEFLETRRGPISVEELYSYLHASDALVIHKDTADAVVVSSTAYLCLGSGCPILAYDTNFFETLEEEVIKYRSLEELAQCLKDVFEGRENITRALKAADKYVAENSELQIGKSFIELFKSL
jgi:hypothetical protein